MSVATISINGIEKNLNINDVIICKTKKEADIFTQELGKIGFHWGDMCGENTGIYSNYYLVSSDSIGYRINENYVLTYSRAGFYTENRAEYKSIMYFDELFTKKEITINELYEVVKAVVLDEGMKPEELNQCFNLFSFEKVIKENTPQSLVEKYRNWNKSKENKIEIGDIFEYTENGKNTERYIVLSIDNDTAGYYNVIWEDFTQSTYSKDFILEDKKIGHKSIDL